MHTFYKKKTLNVDKCHCVMLENRTQYYYQRVHQKVVRSISIHTSSCAFLVFKFLFEFCQLSSLMELDYFVHFWQNVYKTVKSDKQVTFSSFSYDFEQIMVLHDLNRFILKLNLTSDFLIFLFCYIKYKKITIEI